MDNYAPLCRFSDSVIRTTQNAASLEVAHHGSDTPVVAGFLSDDQLRTKSQACCAGRRLARQLYVITVDTKSASSPTMVAVSVVPCIPSDRTFDAADPRVHRSRNRTSPTNIYIVLYVHCFNYSHLLRK